MRKIKQTLQESFPIVGCTMASAFCIVVPFLMTVIPIYIITIIQNISENDIMNIIIIELVGFMILVMIPWVYCHAKQFHIDNGFKLLEGIYNVPQNQRVNFNRLINLGPSVSILLMICVCLIYCVVMISFEIKKIEYSESLVICAMLFILTPIFVYLGMIISLAEVLTEVKIYIFTLFYGVLPLGITIPLYIYYQQYRFFSKYLVVLPPFAMIIWAFLSLISHNRLLYNMLFTLICISIAFPIGFIYPLSHSSIIPRIAGFLVISLLCFLPISLLFIYLYRKIRNFLAKTREEKIKSLNNVNFYYPAWYIIMLCFVFGEGSLIYFYCQGSDNKYGSGGLVGVICLLPIAFSSTSVTLQNRMSDANQVRRKVAIQLFSAGFFVISVPTCVILMYTAQSVGSTFVGAMKSLAAGISIFTIITNIFIIIIQKLRVIFNKENAINPTIPLNLTLWLLLIIPVCVIFPISLSKSPNSKTTNKYIGVLLVYLGLLFMVIVSVISIIYNIYKNKMSDEKLATKCCSTIFREMDGFNIQCNKQIIKDIYEQYEYNKFDDKYLDILSSEEYFLWDEPLGKSRYFKEIVTKKIFDDRRVKSQKKAEQLEIEKQKAIKEENDRKMKKKAPGFWLLLRCFEDYPSEVIRKSQTLKKITQNMEVLHAFEANELEPLPADEFEAIAPPLINHCLNNLLNEKFPKTIKSIDPEISSNIPSEILNNLINDRSSRIDWLKAMFNYIANEPTEFSAEPWLNETLFFQFCRSGGITDTWLTDAELRLIFARVTTFNGLRVVNKDIFVNELIPTIGKLIFKFDDKLDQEIKLVTQLLYPNLSVNITSMMGYQNVISSRRQLDALQKRFTRTLAMKSRINNNPSSSSLVEKNLNGNQKEGIRNTNRRRLLWGSKDNYKCYYLQYFFELIGRVFTNYSIKISEELIKKLYQIYKPSNEKEIEVADLEIKLEKNTEKQKTSINQEIKEWKDACEKMITTIKKLRDADKKDKEIGEPLGLGWTTSNILAVLFKILEFIQLSALGFKTNAKWEFLDNSSPLTQNVMDTANSDPNKHIILIFWVVFSIVILYFILAIRSIKIIESGQAGKDGAGINAKWYSAESLNKRALTLIGGGMYLTIIKYQMNIFACDNDLDPPIIFGSSLECYTDYHISLMAISFIGLMLFYPLATFIYPLLQFNDSALDFKLQQTYLIMLAQAKLLISGIKVFLPYNSYYEYQLAIVSAILFAVLVYTIKKQPSKEWKFNLWSSFGYFVAFLINLMAFVNVQLDGSMIVCIFSAGILCAGLIVTFVLHFRTRRRLLNSNGHKEAHMTRVAPEESMEGLENGEMKTAFDNSIKVVFV